MQPSQSKKVGDRTSIVTGDIEMKVNEDTIGAILSMNHQDPAASQSVDPERVEVVAQSAHTSEDTIIKHPLLGVLDMFNPYM